MAEKNKGRKRFPDLPEERVPGGIFTSSEKLAHEWAQKGSLLSEHGDFSQAIKRDDRAIEL